MTKLVKILVGLIFMALAVGLFYNIFFIFTPWLVEGIPQEGYGIVFTKVIYVLVGYFGGIGIPISIFILGLYFILS